MKIRLAYAEVEEATAEDIAAVVSAVTSRGVSLISAPSPAAAEPAPLLLGETRIPGRRNLRKAAEKQQQDRPNENGSGQPKAQGELTTAEAILAIVRKGPPRTSGEIYDVLREKHGFTGPIGNVYATLAYQKNKGEIESRNDDESEGGQRKWFAR
jgi:hypothetical protein